jgi:hypothetical protein
MSIAIEVCDNNRRRGNCDTVVEQLRNLPYTLDGDYIFGALFIYTLEIRTYLHVPVS